MSTPNPSDIQRYLEIAAELKRTDQRNQQLWEALKKYFGQIKYKVPKSRPVHILNVACGECEEARVLTAFFSTGIFGYPSSNAKLIGIDRDEISIQKAKNLLITPALSDRTDAYIVIPHCEFIVGDATKLDQYAEIHGGG